MAALRSIVRIHLSILSRSLLLSRKSLRQIRSLSITAGHMRQGLSLKRSFRCLMEKKEKPPEATADMLPLQMKTKTSFSWVIPMRLTGRFFQSHRLLRTALLRQLKVGPLVAEQSTEAARYWGLLLAEQSKMRSGVRPGMKCIRLHMEVIAAGMGLLFILRRKIQIMNRP